MIGLETTFQELSPDGAGLFRWLDSALTDHDRHGIAACDYGDEVEGHRAAIDEILRSGRIAKPFDWVPREVLALTRWTEIDVGDLREPALTQHRQRLFAAAALMAQLTLDCLDEDASENTLFGFVDSAIALGQQPLALGMLRWVIGGLEIQVAKEAQLALKEGDHDFRPADVMGTEAPYLPLAMLILDRSQERPVLSSSTVMAAAALGRSLDHPNLPPGAPLPDAALFHGSEPGMREKQWRGLILAALERERRQGGSKGQGLSREASAAFTGWLELALATSNDAD